MADLKQDKAAIDWLVQNKQDPRAPQVMQKLGIDDTDTQAWEFSATNPEDPRSVKIRNKIFLKIAQTRPAIQEQSVSGLDRFAIKNLIDREPELQVKFLERQGFQTRVVDGTVQAKRPEATNFGVIDPEGFDLFDVTDLVGDVAEGIVGAVATGAKAVGLLGAPATGGASLLAGSALGGASTAGFEAGRQAIGKAVGLREEFDLGQIGQAGLLGAAVPGVTGLLGAGAKKAGAGLRGILPKRKADAAIIEQAARDIGAKATPGQLLDSPAVQALESVQAASTTTAASLPMRRQIGRNIKASEDAAEFIVKDATVISKLEAGEAAEQQIKESIAKRLAPAETIYNDIEGRFKFIKPKLAPLKEQFEAIAKEFKLDDKTTSLINRFKDKIDPSIINNLDDLKKFRTSLGNSINKGTATPSEAKAINELYKSVTEFRSSELKRIIGNKADLLQQVEKADSIWRETIQDVEKTILPRGAQAKLGAKREAARFFEKTPEIDRINKILKTNDPKRIAKVKQTFPEAFETLRTAKIQDFAEKASTQGQINPRKLATNIDKMPSETAKLIFGEEALLKAEALRTFLNSVPAKIGPSGTPQGLDVQQTLNIFTQISSLGRQALIGVLSNPNVLLAPLEVAGRGLAAPATRAAGITAGQSLLPRQQVQTQGTGLTIPGR